MTFHLFEDLREVPVIALEHGVGSGAPVSDDTNSEPTAAAV